MWNSLIWQNILNYGWWVDRYPQLRADFLRMGTFKGDLLIADKLIGFYETSDIKFAISFFNF